MRHLVAFIVAGALVLGFAALPANAHDGWYRDGWYDQGWREHEWRERAWRRHEWREHHRWEWYPGYYGYGHYVPPPSYYYAPGVTLGFTFR